MFLQIQYPTIQMPEISQTGRLHITQSGIQSESHDAWEPMVACTICETRMPGAPMY